MFSFSGRTGRPLLLIILAFAAIYLIWGTTYLAIRIAIDTVPPFLMAGARFVLAGLITLTFLRLRGVAMPQRHQWRSAALIGAFMLVGGNGFVTWAEQEVPTGIAALFIATEPVWITFLDWLGFGGPRPNRRVVLGLALGLLGLGLLLGPSVLAESTAVSPLSWGLIFLAPILWGIGSLLSRQADVPAHPFVATGMEMLAGGLLLLLAGLLTGEATRLDLAAITLPSLLAFLYLVFFGSIIAFTAYIWLLKRVQATRVATYSFVNPIIAVFLGWLLLNEAVDARIATAGAIIILAVILIIRQQGTAGKELAQESLRPVAERATLSRPAPERTGRSRESDRPL